MHVSDRWAELTAETRRRSGESLRLYRPRDVQLPFHLTSASEKVARGGVRSGKTTCAAAEVASAATGIPLTGRDGKPIPYLYPTQRPVLIWIIGYDEKHIGRIYKKLFKPGLFKLIKDRQTRRLRTWRPWEADDLSREDETTPAPPLIPARFIQEWAWENKAERVFTVCRLKNGTELHAFPSGAAPGQGDPVDLIWIDEDIKYPRHVEEWQSRLSDVRGRLLWSAWPHSANDALVNMSQRAANQKDRTHPDVFEIVLKLSDNPYIPKDEIRKRLDAWGPTISRSRDLGEFLTDTVLVFPTFNIPTHGIGGMGCPRQIKTALRQHHDRPPWTWTHYLVLDPGHTQPAVLLAAVPPPELGDHVVVWGEVYTPNCDANQLAKDTARLVGNTAFEAFIIDGRAGRITPTGFSKTVQQQYSEAFARHGLKSRATGSDFIIGSDNISARNMAVRNWLEVREDGTTKLLVVDEATRNMQREFRLYKKKITRSDIRDEVVDRHNHLADCCAYLAAYDPQYVTPDASQRPRSPAYLAHLAWDKANNRDSDSIYFGPGRQRQPAPV